MLKICTVYFEGLYKPEHVSKLYRSLKENSTVPFEFICLSDTDVEADVVLPYNHHSNIKKHWHKLKYFSPQFAYQNPGDDIIIMDIDQQIVGNVDEILNYPVKEGELLTYDSWWNVKTNKFADRVIIPINGGFYKFKSGSFKYVWDDFSLNPEYWQLHYYNKGDVHYKYYGEQNYVEDCCKRNNVKITHMPGEWVCKLNSEEKRNTFNTMKYMELFDKEYMVLDEPHPDIKIVHFAGAEEEDTIHDYEDKFGWIKDNWHA